MGGSQEEVGQILRRFRQKRKIKQKDIAAIAKVSQPTWSLIEHGKAPLSLEAYKKLKTAYGAELQSLIHESPRIQITTALETAWKAYDLSRSRLLRMANGIHANAKVLQPYCEDLEKVLPRRCHEQLHWLLDESENLSRVADIVAAKELCEGYAESSVSFGLNDESLQILQKLADIFSTLPIEDSRLLYSIACRLSSTSKDPH